jgi:3-dehydroquinate dehydratase type I
MQSAIEADYIETRIDYQTEILDFEALRAASNKPLIATNRRRDQGGDIEQPESRRIGILLKAVEAGFDMVDLSSTTIDLVEHVKRFQGYGAKVIASHHDYEHTHSAEEIEEIHTRLSVTGCDMVKIIGWADNYGDNLPYISYNKVHPGNIGFAMGEKGTTSRILAPLTGAAYTYASLDEEVAPGQIPLKDLRMIYRSLDP